MLEDLPEEVLHARGGFGLSEDAPARRAARAAGPRPSALAWSRRHARADEVADVVALLLDHADPRAGSADRRAAMATTIAVACLGDEHLWQDLQLHSRDELTALMRAWFPALVERNAADMKWKKFLYKQLCEREQILVCKAPSCAVCSDRPVCFGPETAGA